ncbi:3-hydroxyacyl-CoA dehydrogenase [Iodidimonas gelatinilytica]|uniref:3-hydroxyacyl-CoA dehydrogenase n=1 Tax=Iodidimonas gelatinilytica TaxID=1236966 RepID=A0A5A7MZN9_9PROT|nr:SDR family NAD(P)-dependent oxidoreductase [Iodidimonas gelatinilytica]GEQ98379.1 3-hydroxyacyl-CoA dehydrogenase [Iodidimonas gelatinilytica]GER00429.1 3-hydroxyacyl-CoA dehydrogenase [Iodidimonas gelatinilytica]
MQLKDTAVIVTGGASGLGGATSRHFAAKGAKIAIFDLNAEKGAALAAEIGGLYAQVDVTDEASVSAALDMAQNAHGTARILVNCAGIGAAAKTVSRGEPHPLDSFKKVIEVNLIGTFNCIRLVAARMISAELMGEERGVIINTASIAAFDGQIGQVAYAASKGGIAGLTLPVARDLADKQIRCTTIAPGLFLTPLLMGLPEDARISLGKSVPHPARLGDPSEYALLAEQIVQNPMLNGETIRLDGALRMAPR